MGVGNDNSLDKYIGWERNMEENRLLCKRGILILFLTTMLSFWGQDGEGVIETCLVMYGLGFYRFSVTLLYYGIMFQIPDLSGERHLNFFLGAVVEVISYVLAYIILSRFGRRLPMASFLLVSGAICITIGAISAVPGKDAYWIGKNIQLCPRICDLVSVVYIGLKKKIGKLKK
jgi:hypothetical protein